MNRKITVTVTLPDDIGSDADLSRLTRVVTNAISPYTDELILKNVKPRIDISVEG